MAHEIGRPGRDRMTGCGPVAAVCLPTVAGPVAHGTRAVVPNATFVERLTVTDDIAIFRLRPDDPVSGTRPGQYMSVGLWLDGQLVQRPYSSASRRSDAELEFLVRRVAGGRLTPWLWRIAPGARVLVGRPKGLFTLDAADPRHHLLVGTGTGLAPLAAMLDELLMRPAVRVTLVHGVAHADELAYRDRLTRLAAGRRGIAYVPVVSRPGTSRSEGWAGPTGHVDDVVRRLAARRPTSPSEATVPGQAIVPGEAVAYLCGNPAVIAGMRRALAEIGLHREAVRAEEYWPADREPGD